MRTIILFFILFISSLSHGFYISNVTFSTTPNHQFEVFINEKPVNIQPLQSLRIINIGAGTYEVRFRITSKNGNIITHKGSIMLESGFEQAYYLDIQGSTLFFLRLVAKQSFIAFNQYATLSPNVNAPSFFIPYYSYLQWMNLPLIDYMRMDANGRILQTTQPTIAVSTTPSIALTDTKLENIILELNKRYKDSDRSTYLKLALLKQSITVEQLKKIIDHYQIDEYKLNFVKYISPQISDLENSAELTSCFTYKSTVQELEWYLSTLASTKF
jgi:hypothetical protein